MFHLDVFIDIRQLSARDRWLDENTLAHWKSVGVFGRLEVSADVDQRALVEVHDESQAVTKRAILKPRPPGLPPPSLPPPSPPSPSPPSPPSPSPSPLS